MLNKLPLLFPWKHSKTKTAIVMAEAQPTAIATMEDEAVDVSEDLHPCTICGRTFLPNSLEKHTRVCERNAAKKRKIFNSLKQRVEGTDLAPFHQRTYLKKPDTLAQKQEPPPRPNNWKLKHLELVNTIRAAKGVEPAMSNQKRPSLGASTNEQCPTCERFFGIKAYDRHVEWCKERQTTIHKSPASVQMAKERLEARTKYRAPLNKSKRAATREKYSLQTSQTDSTSNMKSNSACTLDRTTSVRKSKTVINKKSVETMNDHSSQDEQQYHDRKDRYERDVGDMCAKQVASSRSDKDVNKKQIDNVKGQKSKQPASLTKLNNIDVNETYLAITVCPVNTTNDCEEKKMTTWKDTVTKTKKVATHASTSILVTPNADSIAEETKNDGPPKLQTFSKLCESKSEPNTAENFKMKVVVKEKAKENRYSQIHAKSKLPVLIQCSSSSPSMVNLEMPCCSKLTSPANSLEDGSGSKIPTKMPNIRKNLLHGPNIRHSNTKTAISPLAMSPEYISPGSISPDIVSPRSTHDKIPVTQFKFKEIRRTPIQSPKPTKTPRREPICLKKSPKQCSFDFIITTRNQEEVSNVNTSCLRKLDTREIDKLSEDDIGTIFLEDENSDKGKIALDDLEETTDYVTSYCDNQIENLKATLLGMEKSFVVEESPRETITLSDSEDDSDDPVIPSLDSPVAKSSAMVNTGDIGVNFVMQKTGKEKDLFCERFLERNKLIQADWSSDDRDVEVSSVHQLVCDDDNVSNEEDTQVDQKDFGTTSEYKNLKLSIDNISNNIGVPQCSTGVLQDIDSLELELNPDDLSILQSTVVPAETCVDIFDENRESYFDLDNKAMEGGDCQFRDVDDICKELQEIKENIDNGVFSSSRGIESRGIQTDDLNHTKNIDDQSPSIPNARGDAELKNFDGPDALEQNGNHSDTSTFTTFTIPSFSSDEMEVKFGENDTKRTLQNTGDKRKNIYCRFEDGASIGLQSKTGNINLEDSADVTFDLEVKTANDLTRTKSKSGTIYWKKPLDGDNFSETDSVVDGCVGDHSHALSIARIERQVRNCCSDLCLQKTTDTSFVSFTEIDLHKNCSHPNTHIPGKDMTVDEILEIAGEQFVADFGMSPSFKGRRGSLVRIPSTPKIPPDMNFDIPNKRRRIENYEDNNAEFWVDLKRNILLIKERKRLKDSTESFDDSSEDLRSLISKAGDVLNVKSEPTSSESVEFTQLSTINETSSCASSKLLKGDLKCRPNSASTCSELSPRFLHLIKKVLNSGEVVTPRDIYTESDDDLITVSKKHCKRMLYMDKDRLSSVLESQPLRLPKIVQRCSSEKRVKSPKECLLPNIDCANSVDTLAVKQKNDGERSVNIKRPSSLLNLPRVGRDVELAPKALSSDQYDPFLSAEKQFMELLECDDFKPFTSKTKPVTPTQRPHTTDNKKAKSKSPSPAPSKKITKTDRSLSNKVLHNTANKAVHNTDSNNKNSKRASVIDPPADFRDRLSMLNDDFELIENLINESFTKNLNTKSNNEANKLYSKADNESFSLNAILRGRKYSDDLSSIDPRLINENDDLSIPDHFNDQDSSPTSTSTLNCYDNSGYTDHFSETFESKVEPGKTTEIKLKQSISMLDDVSNSFLEDKQLDEFLITLKTPTDEKVKPTKKAPKLSKLPKQISINSSAGVIGRNEDKKKNLKALKRSMTTLDPVQKPKPMKSNQDIQNYFNEQDQRSPTNMLSPKEISRNSADLNAAEELFSVDDAMYEEYKMFEEMYLKEKEEKMRTASEDDDSQQTQQQKGSKVVSGDSAYGSLNRRTPKARATKTKLSPLDSQKSLVADSPCSSSSESSPVPLSSAPKMSKYCHECGNRYPLAAAKFCVECGVKRLVL